MTPLDGPMDSGDGTAAMVATRVLVWWDAWQYRDSSGPELRLGDRVTWQTVTDETTVERVRTLLNSAPGAYEAIGDDLLLILHGWAPDEEPATRLMHGQISRLTSVHGRHELRPGANVQQLVAGSLVLTPSERAAKWPESPDHDELIGVSVESVIDTLGFRMTPAFGEQQLTRATSRARALQRVGPDVRGVDTTRTSCPAHSVEDGDDLT